MCMYTEREFEKVRDAISAMQVQLVGDAGRDRHEWASAIQAVRHAHAEDRTELRGAIDQMRHAIDRIRQKMTQLDLQRDGSSARQALTSDLPHPSSHSHSSSPPALRGVKVCGVVERELYTELMNVQVAIRDDRRQWDASFTELRHAIELLRHQMRVLTATAATTATTTPRRHQCLICHSPCDSICVVCRSHRPRAGVL